MSGLGRGLLAEAATEGRRTGSTTTHGPSTPTIRRSPPRSPRSLERLGMGRRTCGPRNPLGASPGRSCCAARRRCTPRLPCSTRSGSPRSSPSPSARGGTCFSSCFPSSLPSMSRQLVDTMTGDDGVRAADSQRRARRARVGYHGSTAPSESLPLHCMTTVSRHSALHTAPLPARRFPTLQDLIFTRALASSPMPRGY